MYNNNWSCITWSHSLSVCLVQFISFDLLFCPFFNIPKISIIFILIIGLILVAKEDSFPLPFSARRVRKPIQTHQSAKMRHFFRLFLQTQSILQQIRSFKWQFVQFFPSKNGQNGHKAAKSKNQSSKVVFSARKPIFSFIKWRGKYFYKVRLEDKFLGRLAAE